MNILQTEDLVKGMPDQQLMQQAKTPQGNIPQYLLISEVQRRTNMRKRFQAQKQQPEGTVADQILGQASQGIRGLDGPPQAAEPGRPQQMAPPPPPQQMPAQGPQGPQGPPQRMAGGGIVELANGGQVMTVPDKFGRMQEISWAGYPSQQAAFEAFWAGQNAPTNIRDRNAGESGDFNIQFDPSGGVIGMGGYESP